MKFSSAKETPGECGVVWLKFEPLYLINSMKTYCITNECFYDGVNFHNQLEQKTKNERLNLTKSLEGNIPFTIDGASAENSVVNETGKWD